MTTDQQAYDALRAMVREPVELPEDSLHSVLAVVPRTPQARHRSPHIDAGRLQSLSRLTRFAVVVALVGGLLLVAQPFERVNEPGAEGLPPVTGPAANGLIALDHHGDIFVGDPVTGETKMIVAGPKLETSPKFSPDGTRIAFWRANRPPDETDLGDIELVVVRADGSDELGPKLPDGPFGRTGGDFIWSPDGRSLVLTQWTGGGGPSVALWLLDPTGVAEARPLAGSAPYGFGGDQVAWFLRPPSADRLLISNWGADPILSATDLEGSDVLVLAELADLEEARHRAESATTDEHYRGVWDAAWSPDASRIAFVASAGSDPYSDHLFVIDEDGIGLRLLHEEGGEVASGRTAVGSSVAWSPDGSRIAYVRWVWSPGSVPADRYDGVIVILDAETGAERVLEATNSPDVPRPDGRDGPFKGWSWSPDGRSILYAPTETTRVFTIDVDTESVTEVPWVSDALLALPSWQRVAAD